MCYGYLMQKTTEAPTVDEHGAETHPSFITVRASRITSTPGASLFQSDIRHREFIRVTISKATRTRNLKHDWIFSSTTLVEFDLSMAQWGAFVSSFGDGSGVPATLNYVADLHLPTGNIPYAPHEARLAHSIREVENAAEELLTDVTAAQEALSEGFARNAGRKEMKELVRGLEIAISNAKSNVGFTANSLTEHAENVTEKMRADVEGMVLQHAATLGLDAGDFIEVIPEITSGK